MLYVCIKKLQPCLLLLLLWWGSGGWETIAAQSDSLRIKVDVGLRGRWQMRNLNQLGFNPELKWRLSGESNNVELQGTYQFLRVEGFNVISDFWSNAFYQHGYDQKVFPMVMVMYGFARSYKIDHSVLAGAGVGFHGWRKSQEDFLRLQIYTGYLNLKFEEEVASPNFTLGSAISAAFRLGNPLGLSWELQTYHPISNTNLWGFNNALALTVALSDQLFISISHSTVFNAKTVTDIEKVNTLMTFGFQCRFIALNN